MEETKIILRFVTNQAFFPSKMHSFVKTGVTLSDKFLGVSINVDVIPNGLIMYIINIEDLKKIIHLLLI